MSDTFSENRFELDRLIRMGRETLGPPTPRQLLTARTLDPTAWSDHAEEHIAWCMTYGLTSSTSHFGAQYLVRRRIAAIRAAELLRRLDRQATGLPDLEPFDPQAMSTRLEKQAFALHCADHRRTVSHKAAKAVFFMKDLRGVPSPTSTMDENGSVTLAWTEDDRSATVSIDVDGAMTLSVPGCGHGPIPISFDTWRDVDGTRRITAVTDWIHFGGARPALRSEEPSVIAATA